jgi:hypothetical protein
MYFLRAGLRLLSKPVKRAFSELPNSFRNTTKLPVSVDSNSPAFLMCDLLLTVSHECGSLTLTLMIAHTIVDTTQSVHSGCARLEARGSRLEARPTSTDYCRIAHHGAQSSCVVRSLLLVLVTSVRIWCPLLALDELSPNRSFLSCCKPGSQRATNSSHTFARRALDSIDDRLPL